MGKSIVLYCEKLQLVAKSNFLFAQPKHLLNFQFHFGGFQKLAEFCKWRFCGQKALFQVAIVVFCYVKLLWLVKKICVDCFCPRTRSCVAENLSLQLRRLVIFFVFSN